MELSVDIANYKPNDPRLAYRWSISPDLADIGKTELSVDNSVFTLLPGALQPATEYTLTVSITNQDQ